MNSTDTQTILGPQGRCCKQGGKGVPRERELRVRRPERSPDGEPSALRVIGAESVGTGRALLERKAVQALQILGGWMGRDVGVAHLLSRHRPGEQTPLLPKSHSPGPPRVQSQLQFCAGSSSLGESALPSIPGPVSQPKSVGKLTHTAALTQRDTGEELVDNIPASHTAGGRFCMLSMRPRKTEPDGHSSRCKDVPFYQLFLFL